MKLAEYTIDLHPSAPDKPAEGQACNGCGVCCAQETCPVARLRYLKSTGPCPALEWSATDHRYFCGLLSRPGHHLPFLPQPVRQLARPLLMRWIAAGKGCDCSSQIQE